MKKRASRERAAIVTGSLCGILALGASACGSNHSASGQSGTQSSGGASHTLSLSGPALVKAAEKEGTVTFVTSLAGKDVPTYVNAFQKAYPKIHVQVDRGAESSIIPATINAIQAGKSPGDLLEVTSSGALELSALPGALSPFYDPAAASIPPADQTKAKGSSKDDTFIADRVSYIGFGWNTKSIPAKDVPYTFQDLLNPALKGKLGIETDDTSEEWIGLVLHLMGSQKGKEFLKKLGAESKIGQDDVSGAEMMSLVASGQYGGSPAVFQSHAKQHQELGAPVNWHPLNNTAISNLGEMGVFASAKNPAAALLFIDFVTSKAGRQMVLKTHLQLPETKTPFKSWLPTSGYSATGYSNALDSWKNLQKADFGG